LRRIEIPKILELGEGVLEAGEKKKNLEVRA
jgi:hypothetical protein